MKLFRVYDCCVKKKPTKSTSKSHPKAVLQNIFQGSWESSCIDFICAGPYLTRDYPYRFEHPISKLIFQLTCFSIHHFWPKVLHSAAATQIFLLSFEYLTPKTPLKTQCCLPCTRATVSLYQIRKMICSSSWRRLKLPYPFKYLRQHSSGKAYFGQLEDQQIGRASCRERV